MTSSLFDDMVYGLQRLSLPGETCSPAESCSPPCFKYSGERTIIDAFAPRRPSFDLSPTSSASSDMDSSIPYGSNRDAFIATRSRVVRVSHACFAVVSNQHPRRYSTCPPLGTRVPSYVCCQRHHASSPDVS